MDVELKPCPFCGCKAIMFNSGNTWPVVFYRVITTNNCCMQSKFYNTPKEAAEEWNRRVERIEKDD